MVSLEELIPNPELDFLNSDLKIHFWTNLGGKSIPCLFLFETLLLFLDILLLYFTGGSESTKCLYFYFIVLLWIYIYIYIYHIYSYICSCLAVSLKFIFTSFFSILKIFGFLGLISIQYELRTQKQMEEQIEEMTSINQ